MNCDCPAIRHPDLCLFLDVSPETALSRIQKRGEQCEIFEKIETLTAVRQAFLTAFSALDDKVVTIDANADADTVAKSVWQAVEELLNT